MLSWTSSSKTFKIAVLPGDGVGPEVVAEAVRVLQTVGESGKFVFSFDVREFGGFAIDSRGKRFGIGRGDGVISRGCLR